MPSVLSRWACVAALAVWPATPDQPPPALQEGIRLSGEGRHQEAVAALDRAIQTIPNLAEAHYHRGLAYRRSNQNDRALTDLSRALEIRPAFPAALLERARLYHLATRQLDLALADYDRLLQLEPNMAPAWSSRAQCYVELQRWQKVLADANEALRLDPRLAPAYYARAQAFAALDLHQVAIRDYTELLRLRPNHAAGYTGRAASHRALGELREALHDVLEALERQPDYGPAVTLRDQLLVSSK